MTLCSSVSIDFEQVKIGLELLMVLIGAEIISLRKYSYLLIFIVILFILTFISKVSIHIFLCVGYASKILFQVLRYINGALTFHLQYFIFVYKHCPKKRSFPLRISLVNVTKSTVTLQNFVTLLIVMKLF